MAHDFWDAYLEHEAQAERPQKRFAILRRILDIPLFHYARYFEQYRSTFALTPMLVDLIGQDEHQSLEAQAMKDAAERGVPYYPGMVRQRFNARLIEDYEAMKYEVHRRWHWEERIRQPNFHFLDLDASDLNNWSEYLDFEESNGDYARIKFLYERCLIPTASYSRFWLRYTRWLVAQDGKSEEIRNAYERASCITIRIPDTEIRHNWATYEESEGRVAVAIDIHKAILLNMPDDIKTHISLAHLWRRAEGVNAASNYLLKAIADESLLPDTRGALVSEWAELELCVTSDYTSAARLFETYWRLLSDSYVFWTAWIDLEADRDKRATATSEITNNVKRVHSLAQTTSKLPKESLKQLASYYMAYLSRKGGPDAAKEIVLMDAFIHGPMSVHNDPKFNDLFNPQPGMEKPPSKILVIEHAE